MATKVTNDQVNRANFTVDDFRKAVNYVNTKNKGYVRFDSDGKGGVKIAKVNNKIDIFIGWRTNIDAAKNQAIREKFAQTITHDLKWANKADVQKIADKILTGKKGGEKRTDPLSRKDLEAAFKDYDKIMNSPTGRKELLDNMFRDAATSCGLGGTDDNIKEFKEKYLKLTGKLATFDYDMMALNDGVREGPNRMKMPELEFKGLMRLMENACDDAVKRAQVDRALRTKAESFVDAAALDNNFALHFSQQDKAEFRGALQHFLLQKGVIQANDQGGIVGTGGMIFNKFVEDVLPELFKQNVQNIRAYGDGADKQLHMDANFSFDAILDEAEKFITGAKQYIAKPPKAQSKSLGNAKLDAIVNNARQAVDGAKNVAFTNMAQKMVLNIADNSNIGKGDAKKIMNDFQGGMQAQKDEGHLGTFTKNFLAERGIGEAVAEKDRPHDALQNTLDSIIATGLKAKIAAQLQYGTAKKNPETGIRESKDTGMGTYVSDMENAIGEIASGNKGMDMILVSKLLTFTLARIASNKVDKVANGIGVDLKLDKDSEEDDKKLLKSTADAYMSFESKVLKLINNEKNAFIKLARTQLKKELIDEKQFNDLVAHAQEKFADAHKAALEGFFLKSPVTDAEAGTKLLTRIFKEKLAEARDDLNNALAVNSMGRTIGVRAKAELRKVDDHVADALAQPGMTGVKLGKPGVISGTDALATLKKGALRRLYSKTLAEKLKSVPKVDGHKTITEAFVADVKRAYNKKAMDLVKSVAKFENDFVKACEDAVGENIKTCIEEDLGTLKGYSGITKDEKAKLVKDMTAEIMIYKSSQLKNHIQEILDAPESFTKKDVKALAKEFFDEDGVEKTGIARTLVSEKRKEMVEKFLADDNMSKKIMTLVSGNGVFGKGGALENVYRGLISEGESLANRAIKTVRNRVAALPLVYATGDKESLAARIADEADKVAQGYAKAWAKFRTNFLNKIKSVDEDFASLGKDRIETALRWTLSELSRRDDFDKIDMNVAVGFYRSNLKGELDYTVNKAKESFEAYSAKVKNVYDNAMKVLGDKCNEALARIEGCCTPEAKEYLKDVIIPKMKQRIEFALYANPDDFDASKLAARKAEIEKTFLRVVEGVFSVTTTNDNAPYHSIAFAGADVLLKDDAETDAAVASIKTWVGSPEGHKLQVASEKAHLDYILEYGDSFDPDDAMGFAPTDPGNAVAAFRFALRDELRFHSVPLLYTAFDNTKVGEAKQVFEKWLDSHAMSKFEDYRKTNAHDRIMAKFDERVKLLQENALAGGKNEPILTPEFIAVVDRIIDSDGVQALLSDWKNKQMDLWLAKFAERDNWHKFALGHPGFNDLTPPLQKTVSRNNQLLMAELTFSIAKVAGEADGKEGIDATKKFLDGLDIDEVTRRINDDLVAVFEKGERAYNLEEGAANVISRYSHSIERALIKGVVSEKNADKFKGGLIDLLELAQTNEKVGKNKNLAGIVTALKGSIALTLGETYKYAKENDYILDEFEKKVKVTAETFLADVRDNKELWKNGLLPALKAADKELK